MATLSEKRDAARQEREKKEQTSMARLKEGEKLLNAEHVSKVKRLRGELLEDLAALQDSYAKRETAMVGMDTDKSVVLSQGDSTTHRPLLVEIGRIEGQLDANDARHETFVRLLSSEKAQIDQILSVRSADARNSSEQKKKDLLNRLTSQENLLTTKHVATVNALRNQLREDLGSLEETHAKREAAILKRGDKELARAESNKQNVLDRIEGKLTNDVAREKDRCAHAVSAQKAKTLQQLHVKVQAYIRHIHDLGQQLDSLEQQERRQGDSLRKRIVAIRNDHKRKMEQAAAHAEAITIRVNVFRLLIKKYGLDVGKATSKPKMPDEACAETGTLALQSSKALTNAYELDRRLRRRMALIASTILLLLGGVSIYLYFYIDDILRFFARLHV